MKYYLNEFMRIADVSGTQLARNLGVDSSYISLVRTGKRSINAQNPLLPKIAEFLSSQLKSQRCALEMTRTFILCPTASEMIREDAFRFDFIYTVLATNPEIGTDLSSILHVSHSSPNSNPTKQDFNKIALDGADLYLGVAGRQQAVTQFFRRYLKQSRVNEIYAISDSQLNWIKEPTNFYQSITKMFGEAVARDSTFHVLINPSPGLFELDLAADQIEAIILAGSKLDLRYLPQVRDGVLSMSLLFTPDLCGLLTVEILSAEEQSLTFFVSGGAALISLMDYFNRFRYLSKPLFEQEASNDPNTIMDYLVDFGVEGSDPLIYWSSLPSLYTLPDELRQEIIPKEKQIQCAEIYERTKKLFADCLRSAEVRDYLSLPAPSSLTPSSLRHTFAPFLGLERFEYSYARLRQHLQALIYFIDNEPNYHLILGIHDLLPLDFIIRPNSAMLIQKIAQETKFLVTPRKEVIDWCLNRIEELTQNSFISDPLEVKNYLYRYIESLEQLDKT